jgi:large repetitive protein
MRKFFYSFLILLVLIITSGVYAQPQPPVLVYPPDNAIGVPLFPTFTWDASAGATSYRLQIWYGTDIKFDQSGITGTSYTLASAVLAGGTTYYWRMNATGPSGTGEWSGNSRFTTTVVAPNAPYLISPVNDSIDVALTPFLDWSDVEGANQYRVQVALDSFFTAGLVILDIGGLTNSGYYVQSGVLSNNTIYYWRARARNAGGEGNWSATWNFKTVPAAPVAPVLYYPTNGATNVPVNLTFKWRKSVGATAYHIQVSLNNTFTANVINEDAPDTLFVVPPGTLSGTTQYFWRVYAKNVGGSSPYSTVWSFTTAIAPPASPVLVSPPNHSTGIPITGILFSWNPVSGATSYRIQVSTDPNFGSTIVNQSTGSQTQYLLNNPPLTNNTIYYWRVNATNTGGQGLWSQVWDFTTIQSTLPPPTLLYPANNAQNIPLTPNMDWSDVTGASGYRLQIATTSSFTAPVLDVTIDSVSHYVVPSGILQGYTQYYWRVATLNGGGQGSWSSPYNFRTLQTFNLNLKVYLEGFYNGSTQVSDTVKVFLANATTFTFVDTSSAILGTNGVCNNVSFARATSGNYWIAIRHRNHLETWSSIVKYFTTGSPVNYDFTTSASQAYGNNMKQVGSVWVLYGGDANQDGFVNGYDYDIYKIQFGLDAYRSCDFNGDNFVDGYDLPILISNLSKNKIVPHSK